MVKHSTRLRSVLITVILIFSLLHSVGSQPVLSVTVTGNASVNMCQQYDYVITVTNTSATETATSVVVSATVPAGFRIDDAGGGSVAGQTITWNVGTLDPSASWSATITLYMTCTAVSGQILVDVTHAAGSSQGSLYVSVQPGAITITKTPAVVAASLGDTVHWTVTVTSTGFGPVTSVVVRDTLGSGLQYDQVQSTPGDASGLPVVMWDSSYLPALATMNPGDQVTIEVYAQVIACSGLENNAEAAWSCNGTPCETETTKASVQLILREPEISYTLPNFQIDYCSSGTQFIIPITNSGTGDAYNFWLYADFDGLTVNVTAPVGGFYDDVNNRFFVGDILPSTTVNLIFTLSVSDWCGRPLPAGSPLFEPVYEDECGEVFYPPVQIGSYSISNVPSLSVSKTGAPTEIYLGESITYTIVVTYSGPLSCGTGSASSITVVDTIPNGFTVTDSGGGSIVGNTITWTVDPAVGLNTTITLQAPDYTECETYCYTYATNSITATMTDCCGCPLTASDAQTTAIECEEYYVSDKVVVSTTNFEKCTEIDYTNTYAFDDDPWWDSVAWTDFIFYEEMANAQEYVGGSVSVTVFDGVQTCTIIITPSFAGGQMILDFNGGDYSSCSPFPAIRGSTLTISYPLQTTDSSSPGCEASYSFYDWSVLDTGKTGGVCQPDQELQETVYVTVNQAQMSISISGVPGLVDDCDVYNVTIDITRTSAVGAYDVLVDLPTQNYAVTITGYTGPVPTVIDYGTYLEFTYGDAFATQGSAQILATFEKRCGTLPDVSATVYWDGYCRDDDTYDRECSATAASSPRFLQAFLFITKTPELIYATQNQVTWTIYVTNSGSGNAHNVWVEDVLGSDLTYNSSSVTDLLGNPVAVTTNINLDRNGNPINGVTWLMFEIPAGQTRIITLTANIIGCANLDDDVSTSWGCLGVDCRPPVSDHSTVAIPPANAVTTNILPAYIDLCGQDTVTVQVKNAGLTTIYNTEVEVTLPPGLVYVTGSGSPSDPQNPAVNPLKWTSVEVPALASIAPGVVVSISFDVIASCTFPGGNRTVISKAYYESVCGELKISPESRSVLPVRVPTVTIAKDGRNITQGGVSYIETVNAEPGDLVEWRIRISNTGAATAENVEFWDVLPANMTFSSISPAPPGGGSGTLADPWVHGDLLTGQTATYYVQATVNPNGCTENPSTNTAYVRYGCDDGCRMPQTSNTALLRTTAQFTISQTLGTITTCDGSITVTVRNNGPTAYNVTVTSDLPAGFVYDSMISGPNPFPDPPADLTRPVWVIGNMLEAQTVVLNFAIKDDGTNCGVVTPDVNVVSVDFDNACGQHYTRTNSRNVSPLKAVLTVTKTPETQVLPPGGTASWTITVTNTGNYQADSVEVSDVLSANFYNISAGNGSGGEVPLVIGNTVTWNVASIPIGGTWTGTLSAQISLALGIDTVTVTGRCSTGCAYSTASDTAFVQTVEGIFKSPDLQTATIGQEVTFDVYVSYWGTSNYQNVQIIDTLPAGLEYVTSTYTDDIGLSPVPVVVGQSITWTLGNFTGPNTTHITVTARVQNIPANVNGVVVTNWVRTIGAEEGVPFDLSDSADVQIIEPQLTLDKVGSITEGLPGDTIHYTITVENTGTSPAYDVVIEDVIPAGLILDQLSITSTPSADATSVVGNTITWNYSIIPVGSTVILEYDAVIPPEGGTFTNTSSVTDYSSLSGDSIYERHYPPLTDPWTVRAPGTDIVKITLNTAINVPSPGGTVYFELTITNTGSMLLDPVELIDIVPDGLTYLPGTSVVDGIPYEPDSVVDNLDGTQTLTWLNIGAMNPADVIVVTFETQVDPSRVGTFINKAIVIGTSSIGDVSDEDTSPVGVLAPAIMVVKSADPPVTGRGEPVLFTLTVTNTGQVVLNPVQVVDVLPVGLTYADAASILPDSVVLNVDGTTTITWLNIGALAIGESRTITFVAIYNGEEPIPENVVTATGTPPNGSPVSDDDSVKVTSVAPQPPYQPEVSLQPLAYNRMIDCYGRYKEYIERIRRSGVPIDWRRQVPCCENLRDLVDQLVKMVLERGLDKVYPEKWARVEELLPFVEKCCKDIEQYYSAGNYVASNYWSTQRDEAYSELIELLLEMLGF